MLIMYKNPLTCILSDTHNVNHKPRTTTKTSFFSHRPWTNVPHGKSVHSCTSQNDGYICMYMWLVVPSCGAVTWDLEQEEHWLQSNCKLWLYLESNQKKKKTERRKNSKIWPLYVVSICCLFPLALSSPQSSFKYSPVTESVKAEFASVYLWR